MELTLIPLAAILLLLSGARGTVALADGPSTSAALIRLFLIGDAAESQGIDTTSTLPRKPVASALNQLHVAHEHAQLAVQARCDTQTRRLGRNLLRNRFGVATAAFQPMAPPRDLLPRHPAEAALTAPSVTG